MCGIFALLNNVGRFDQGFIEEQFQKGKNRGPEFSILKNVMIETMFGFHRLAINGLNETSNQPLVLDETILICNGEIYNYKELYKEMYNEMYVETEVASTQSDCEVILHLYKHYGIEQTLQMLDGVFSFVLIDFSIGNLNSKIYVARDPYGVRPLYALTPTSSFGENVYSNLFPNQAARDAKQKTSVVVNTEVFAFASELKVLIGFYDKLSKKKGKEYRIQQFEPGSYSVYDLPFKASAAWKLEKANIRYHSTGFTPMNILNGQPSFTPTNILNGQPSFTPMNILNGMPLGVPADIPGQPSTPLGVPPTPVIQEELDPIIHRIQIDLLSAVFKRCLTTERPIACLLSGGLDSSLVTALVSEYHKIRGLPPVETYSIGLQGSDDLHYARIVADYLGTKHTEIVLTEQEFLDAIPDVIKTIESYDTTTVRASIGNWLLGKYIAEHSQAKVIFNGDGSDELMGGYLYMCKAPDCIEYDRECRRLLKDIHTFDVLRSDKSISSHGLEPRTPFLDRHWVQSYLSIPFTIRNHNIQGQMEKYLVRHAFSQANYQNAENGALLPDSILYRKKEAFSDGVSKTTRSLYEIIKEFAEKEFGKSCMEETITEACKKDPVMDRLNDHLLPKTAEQFYYRKIFETHYKGQGKIIPYFWMPKYVNATDASARTLDIYANEAPRPTV
jgi:asparagine synthase (glutamine-hydrolysing)